MAQAVQAEAVQAAADEDAGAIDSVGWSRLNQKEERKMKKVMLAVSLVLAVAVFMIASEAQAGSLNCDSGFGKYVLNKCVDTEDKNKMEVGVGVDVPLYKSEKLVVDQETKIDLNQGEDFAEWDKANIGTYTVFKPQLDEGILQTAFNKIKSFFGSGGE
jgi:hypothetical protein